MIRGLDAIANPVRTTLGPYGQNFLLERGNKVTNDGITIARELSDAIEDDIERRGAKFMLDASEKANDEVGDGSTTAMTLAQEIVHECKQYLGGGKILGNKRPPVSLKNQIEKERIEVEFLLKQEAHEVASVEELVEVAKVSVEDEELGSIIGQAQWELGKDGVLLAELTNDPISSIERVNGLRLDNGFGSVATINNQESQSLELKDVPVLYTSHTIKTLKDIEHLILPLLQKGSKQIVVMSRAFTEEAIRECIMNGEKGNHIYPLNAPYTDQTEIMKDLQAILGGRFLGAEEAELSSAQLSDIGHAERIIAKRYSTTISGKGDTKNRIEELEQKRQGSPSDFEKRNLDTRIAQLKNGFGIVKVGGATEKERKYRFDKAEDAVNAVRAALQEGVVPGAGLTLKKIAESLSDSYLLKRPLMAPHEQIMINAGEPFEIPVWVKDPVKVIRIGLEKACSVAGVFITAGGAITTKTEKPCCHTN